MSEDRVYKLIKPQADFIRSKAKYPAYVASWGTGKSLALIARAVKESEAYPGNTIVTGKQIGRAHV